MPTYEYRCSHCEHEFEVRQSIMDEPLNLCPKCKRSDVRRLIGRGGHVIFKGSGFYCTDYAKESEKS